MFSFSLLFLIWVLKILILRLLSTFALVLTVISLVASPNLLLLLLLTVSMLLTCLLFKLLISPEFWRFFLLFMNFLKFSLSFSNSWIGSKLEFDCLFQFNLISLSMRLSVLTLSFLCLASPLWIFDIIEGIAIVNLTSKP